MTTFNVNNEFDKMMEALGLGELPKDDLQYIEMRKAFIGGTLVMFQTIAALQTVDQETAMQELAAISEYLMNIEI
jgi:hypothetical protein